MLISDLHTIGNKLLFFRKKMNMTQIEVAEAAGLSDRTYADIERGNVNMRLETLLKICTVLHITPNDILLDESSNAETHKLEIIEHLNECPPHIQNTALKLLNVYISSTK